MVAGAIEGCGNKRHQSHNRNKAEEDSIVFPFYIQKHKKVKSIKNVFQKCLTCCIIGLLKNEACSL